MIAVTGGIACGKSTFARFLEEDGCAVLDTDEVAHALQAPGGAAVAPLAERFGGGVIADDGSIDRRALAKIVFADPQALADLNEIMHPLVEKEVRSWISEQGEKAPKAVLVPLLFEAGLDRKFGWDATVAVICRPEEQLRRLMGRGLDKKEALQRIAAQMPLDEKAKHADVVVRNDGSIASLREDAQSLLSSISPA